MLSLLAALHLALSGGVGISNDIAGVRLELRLDHFSASAATGPLLLDGAWGSQNRTAAFGLRWYSGDGERLFIGAQYMLMVDRDCSGPCGDPETINGWFHYHWITAVAGWRFKWANGFFADLGLGGGLNFENDDRYQAHFTPDLNLAFGWEF